MDIHSDVPHNVTAEMPVVTAPPAPACAVWPLSVQIAVAVVLLAAGGVLACKSLLQTLDAGSGTIPAQRIDLNAATHAELLLLPGVGENLADRIAKVRSQERFHNVDDLRKVPGIGPATLERLRGWVFVSAAPVPDDPLPSLPLIVEPSKRPGGKAKKGINLDGPINVNTAAAKQLMEIPGIGPKLSQRIVDERAVRPFNAVADLRRVRGIGPKILEKMRPYVTVTPAANAVHSEGTVQQAVMSESLAGTIERVTFHNPENGFVVLRVEVKGMRGLTTVVGRAATALAGEYFEATGIWHEDSEHGSQFKADSLRTFAPSTPAGIEKYLASGLIKGIGPLFAHRIVEVFGSRTLNVIDESPVFLKEVKGIGARRISQIRASWQQQKVVRDIIVFLQSHGIGSNRAVRIYKTYGDQATEVVRSNPYRLAEDIRGVGFQTADELAQRLGIEAQSPLRARAALRHVLLELSGQGHCAYPEGEVIERAAELTGIVAAIVADAVGFLVEQKEIIRATDIREQPLLYLRHLFFAELGVAKALRELCQGEHPLHGIDVEAALDWVEKKMNLTLAASQRAALHEAVNRKVLVITGGPGVGKTTIVRGIHEVFQAKKLRICLCAPTGRAAKRLAETTGHEATTIHRLLQFDHSGPKKNRDQPLDVDLVVVDEMSMVDLPLFAHLLNALPSKTCLVLVGDVDQLPPVGPGLVLADIIASRAVPVVRLIEVFRQALQSGIVQAAHRIHDGVLPVSAKHESSTAPELADFYIIPAEEPARILDRIFTLIQDRIPARFGLNPFNDIQVLTPMNRSELGVRNLNTQLQAVLNPSQEDAPEVERYGVTFRIGDKVLQTVNNYDRQVFNGDVGRVHKIDLENQEVTVHFDGQPVSYDFGELDELSLAYALTIHKSQGSEYPAVIIPLHTQHYLMLQRNLLYTGITRGKKLVVLVGSAKALSLAVGREDARRRYTALAHRLQ